MEISMKFQLYGPKELDSFTPLQKEKDVLYPSEDPDVFSLHVETEDVLPSFLSSGSYCIDFFFETDICGNIGDHFAKAWQEDSSMALKLAFKLRDVKCGKSDKVGFYEIACWLYEHHPATLLVNIPNIVKAGCYKDLVVLLTRFLESPDEKRKREHQMKMHKSIKEAGEAAAVRRFKWLERERALLENEYGRYVDDYDSQGDENIEEEEKDVPELEPVNDNDIEASWNELVTVEDEVPELETVDNDDASGIDRESLQTVDSALNVSDEGDDVIANVDATHRRGRRRRGRGKYFFRKGSAARAAKKSGTLKPREERIADSLAKGRSDKEAARVIRKDKHLKLAKRVVEKHRNEPKFASIYNAIAELFATDLAKDLEALNKDGSKARISLAAKWCPSLDSSYDRQTLLCEAIACLLFPKSIESELDHYQYVRIVREKLRKEVLVPLRKAMELPEVYIGANEWHSLPYENVPWMAMEKYKELFIKHDEERFRQFLVHKEESAYRAPHKILLDQIKFGNRYTDSEAFEVEWKTMVERLKEKRRFTSSLSIYGFHSWVLRRHPKLTKAASLCLSILTADLTDEPWNGKVIRTNYPEWDQKLRYTLTPKNLATLHDMKDMTFDERYSLLKSQSKYGFETGFTPVDFSVFFDMILELAERSNLPPDRMLKRLFVFTDISLENNKFFDEWDDKHYIEICRKYREAGYGAPPHLVYWNLLFAKKTTVTDLESRPGLTMLFGFSRQILRRFLHEDGEVYDTLTTVKHAITGGLYDELVVVD